MFQLLSLWSQYVEIIYMPEAEIHILSTIEKLDARPTDSAYGMRTQEQDVKNRIKTLFSDKATSEKSQISDDEGFNLKEEYETVNEELTSDTTEAPSQAVKRTELSEAAADSSLNAAGAEKQEQQEGILSSDEEERATVDSSEKAKSSAQGLGEKLMTQPEKPEIKGFDNAAGKLFESHKAKEEIENKYSFSEQDLEFFGAKI